MIRYNRAMRRARRAAQAIRRSCASSDYARALIRPLLAPLPKEEREKALERAMAASPGYVHSNYQPRLVCGATDPQTDAVLARRARQRPSHVIIEVQPMKHRTADLYKQMMENRKASADYYAAHKVCPKCNGSSVSQTYVGYIQVSGIPYRDENDASCLCGWKGTVHDLIPAT